MKHLLPSLAGLALLAAAAPAVAADGRALFEQKCAGCHTLGGGDAVGPDLKGAPDRRERGWLIRFITAPDQVIASGDSTARALLSRFGEMPMPDVGVSEAEAEAILAYLGGAPAPAAPPRPAHAGDAPLGLALFTGSQPFQNGGAACISCHDAGAGALGGGTLAKNLTGVYGRLGEPGLKGALRALPFPLMKDVYRGKPLTEREVAALTAYFASTRDEPAARARHAGAFAGLGALGAAGLFTGMALYWPRRRRSVREKLQGDL